MYKCAAYNPVTQEVKTSGSSDRLRVRRKDRVHLLIMGYLLWIRSSEAGEREDLGTQGL